MIPRIYITEWREFAPWLQDTQVEQDLIISRVLVELFNHPKIASSLAFRGGTALNKLFIQPPARYSEDIDLVQIHAEPIGELFTIIRDLLNPWLGQPKWKLNEGRATLLYSFQPESIPSASLKLKIEINTREHFTIFGYQTKDFETKSRWFNGKTKIISYDFNELIGTKIRALYQRKKGRDLFDLWLALQHDDFNSEKAVLAFNQYMKNENKLIFRETFEANFQEKLKSSFFAEDITPLLSPTIQWDIFATAKEVQNKIINIMKPAYTK